MPKKKNQTDTNTTAVSRSFSFTATATTPVRVQINITRAATATANTAIETIDQTSSVPYTFTSAKVLTGDKVTIETSTTAGQAITSSLKINAIDVKASGSSLNINNESYQFWDTTVQ